MAKEASCKTVNHLQDPVALVDRRSNAQALTPLTIKQCLEATQAHSDAELCIDGTEVGQLTIVAQVLTIARQVTNRVYFLDDATGRIEARSFIDPSSDTGSEGDEQDIPEGSYVRVTGTLKHFANKRYINANHVRPCGFSPSTPLPPSNGVTVATAAAVHELYFHYLEVMQMMVVRKKGPHPQFLGQSASPSTATGGGGGSGAANPYANGQTRGPSGSQSAYSGLQPTQRCIMEFINSQPDTMEGIHITAIARGVASMAGNSVDAAEIASALDKLMDEGHVYSSIDDSHFKAAV
ncbi:nucleic acid-binding protein [Schizopora paradoxa]|uniref:Nucleic acid-binding protein n=1 Tax=Schizopora paradoxa TaxID=27342 RepID=A0A0H2RJQ2_9AGAM|nr:nucleic acid-binding protein [Schizopora paradoxa]